MYRDDLHSRIVLQDFSNFTQVHIHGTGIEVTVIAPDLLERVASVDQFVGFRSKQSDQFIFLGSKLVLSFWSFDLLLVVMQHKCTKSIGF